MVWDSDACCPREHHPSHNTFSNVQSQKFNNKDSFCSEEPKLKDPKTAPSRDNMAAKPTKKKDKKDKKKSFQGQKREHTGEQKEQTPAIDINEAISKKKLKVRCFKFDKKGYYANNCTELLKN